MRAIFKMAENRYQKLVIRKIAHFTSKKRGIYKIMRQSAKICKTFKEIL